MGPSPIGVSTDQAKTSPICAALSTGPLSQATVYATDKAYHDSVDSYYSYQESKLRPLCIVQPDSSEQVAEAIKTIADVNRKEPGSIKFAVRSGGHTVWPGAANVESGVTLDMRKINGVELNPDRESIVIGTGATWTDVYNLLDHENLAVPGGRVANVGVGGLLLGGGISYFSPRKGFVCDFISQYEIVLADGTIRRVTQETDANLFWALKGGSGNFGIVTKFTMDVFEQGQFFAGAFFYHFKYAPNFIRGLHELADSGDNYDENASVICTSSFREGQGQTCFNTLVYTQPVEDPPVLKPFLEVEKLFGTGRITKLTDVTQEQANLSKAGLQQFYITTTLVNDLSMLQQAHEIWNSYTPKVTEVSDICYSLSFQPLPPAITRKSAARGGNPLGLQDAPPLVIVLLVVFWKNEADNDLMYGVSQDALRDIEAHAKSRGLYHDFKYLNYAWQDQDPIGGYGKANKAKLQDISTKVDPEGFFQKVWSGGFKLFQ